MNGFTGFAFGQTLPSVPGAPWWLILLLFAVAPALWRVATYMIQRSDDRRGEYKGLLKEKDDRISELYDRLITEGIESREALATAAKTLEGFVEKRDSIEAKMDHVIDVLQPILEYVEKNDAA